MQNCLAQLRKYAIYLNGLMAIYERAEIMNNIQEQIKQVEDKVKDLRIKLMIEESVLKRLKAIESPEEPLLPLSDNAPILTNVPQQVTQSGTLVANIKAVLAENAGSMHVKDIHEKLKAMSITTDAKAGLAASIANALFRREDIFQRVRRGMYRLRNI